jgi:hypothetical protein
MFADTTFTMKSGPMGTSMFSRVGKYTNYQYLCFNPNQGQPVEDGAGEEAREQEERVLLEVRKEQDKAEEQYMGKSIGFAGMKPSEMGKTKRTEDHLNVEEEEEGEKKQRSPIVAQPGVNTSSFLTVARNDV